MILVVIVFQNAEHQRTSVVDDPEKYVYHKLHNDHAEISSFT